MLPTLADILTHIDGGVFGVEHGVRVVGRNGEKCFRVRSGPRRFVWRVWTMSGAEREAAERSG